MISINSVSNRVRKLNETTSDINFVGLNKNLSNRYNYETIMTLAEHFDRIPMEEQEKLEYLLDLFDEVCMNENDVKVKRASNVLVNEVVHKLRDANQIIKLLSRRKANISHKAIGAVNKAVSIAKQAVGMAGNTVNGSSKVTNMDTKKAKMKKQQDEMMAKNAKIRESTYSKLIESCNVNRNCDRVWKTHENINKRFNTHKVFKEHYQDPELCIKEFCTLLDTYDIPLRAKANICLENIAYEYDLNHKKIDRSILASSITEHFLINSSVFSDRMITEETSVNHITKKILDKGKRLMKHSNQVISKIGEAIVDAVSSGLNSGSKMLDLLGKIIVAIGTVVGIGAMMAGVVVLLCSIAIGILVILTTVSVAIIISPSLRKQVKDSLDKANDKKSKKAINRLHTKIESYMLGKGDKKAIKEDFIELEYETVRDDLEHVLKKNKFYNEQDIQNALGLLTVQEADIDSKFNVDLATTLFGIHEDAVKNKKVSKAKSIMQDILNLPNKSASVLKEKIRSMYSDDPEDIIEETPNLLKMLYHIIVIVGATSISPFLGLIALMASMFISMKVQRQDMKKYIAKYKAERERAKKKGDSIKDPEAKKRNEEYIKELDKAIDRLESYEKDLYTEKEQEKHDKEKEKYDSNSDNKDDSSSDLDDFDLDKELKEATLADITAEITLLDEATRIVSNFDREPFYSYLEKGDLDKRTVVSIIENTGNMYNLRDVWLKLDEQETYQKSNFKVWEAARAGKVAIHHVKPYTNIYEMASACIDANDIIQEMSIGNQLSMLIDKVKSTATKLSDKEKVASRTLDTSLENLRNAMANSLKQENREAVIRGQVLPPASRIIKLALVSGFTFLINPALTVIYLLGVFALSKDLRRKERQIVLDEIDTELKVAAQYVEEAKNKKDMKAYRECLMIEKKLLRQRDRLKYKMNVEYNEKTPTQVNGDLSTNSSNH